MSTISTVGRNIVANALGMGVSMAAFVAVTPVYLHLLGAEGYGLVGLLTTLTLAAPALALGLDATLNREAARMTAQPEDAPAFADTAATLQAAGWVVAVSSGALLALVAPAIAAQWLTFSTLTIADVRTALLLMSAGLPALVARAVYVAALNGLQQQRTVNVIQVGGALVRSAAGVAALLTVTPTAAVFLAVTVVLFYVEVAVAALALRAAWPPSARRGRIRIAALQPVLGFTAGMAGTMLLGLALTSMDRVVLSAILPLDELGYYTLAVTVAAVLGQVVGPVTTAVFPRFSQLFERRDAVAAAAEYHFFSQLVALVVLPLAILLVFFPDAILATWTGDEHLAQLAAPVLSLRTIGTVLNVLLHVPHVVQLASGWSTLGAGVNAVAVLAMIPLLLLLSLQWGGPGAALAWVLLNLGVFVVLMERMHRRVLAGELTIWLARIAMPLLAATVVGALARLAMPAGLGVPGRLAWLAVTALATALATLGVSPLVRGRLAAARRLS